MNVKNKISRGRALLALSALLLGSIVQAQGPDAAWNDVAQRAKGEGKVTLYSVAPPDQGQRVVDAFQKQYPGIKVSVVRGAGDLIPRIGAERASGVDGADVFLYSDPLWFKQNAENLLELNSPAAKSFPAKYWNVPNKSALVSFPPMGMLVWNKTKVPGGLKSYADLLNPAYKEHIGTREDMTAVLAAFLEWQEKSFGAEYLQKLGTQKPKYYASVVPLTQAVAAGEVWIANTSVPSVAKDLIDQGAPIAFVIPANSFAISWAAGALSASKRPNAARLFTSFLITDEGQRALNGSGDAGSPLDAKGALPMSDLAVIDITQYTAERREEWRKKFKQYMGTR